MEKLNTKRARLIELADKLSDLLDLVPPINTAVPDANIQQQIKLSSKLLTETDIEQLQKEDLEELVSLGMVLPSSGKVDLDDSEQELSGEDIVARLKVPEEAEEESVEVAAVTTSVISAQSEKSVNTTAIQGNLITEEDIKPLFALADKKTRAPYFKRLIELILKCKITKDRVIDLIVQEMPDVKPSAVKAAILDSKNPKYSRFKPYYLVEDSEGYLYFARIED